MARGLGLGLGLGLGRPFACPRQEDVASCCTTLNLCQNLELCRETQGQFERHANWDVYGNRLHQASLLISVTSFRECCSIEGASWCRRLELVVVDLRSFPRRLPWDGPLIAGLSIQEVVVLPL